ncbi:uncharacterized protein EI90DRAFT_3039410 [Cantharellus anzutake]|uniref:uncharacterized protein n=1 Tax=Cantharellus anzutake TaxID=1750568 RepID=UPI00190654B6|nr:uncharacterized protein EI90DRAFT_3039410 [Cantharellus anzutake]KAF8338850.1 hypothetical protein EI90DRAFT_3039410 [Cantharellus anzutake]
MAFGWRRGVCVFRLGNGRSDPTNVWHNGSEIRLAHKNEIPIASSAEVFPRCPSS